MLTDQVLHANLRAGARWAAEWDIPDAVGWRDLAFAPDDAVSVMQSRARHGVLPARCHHLKLPKGLPGQFRRAAIIDPYDQILFRGIVASFVGLVDRALGKEVRSYRLSSGPPGWRVKNRRYLQAARRMDASRYLESSSFSGVAFLDIRQYYPSIDGAILAHTLAELGVPNESVDLLGQFLREWCFTWGVDGVPIGPEASGVIGNVFLRPVDEALRRHKVAFSRYSDDYWLFLRTPAEQCSIEQLVQSELEVLGLSLNASKTKYLARGDAFEHVSDSRIEGLRTLLREDSKLGLRRTKDLLEEALAEPLPKVHRIAFCLLVLASSQDPFGVSYAIRDISTLNFAPAQWGRYLSALNIRGLVDSNWLAEVATHKLSNESAAVQIHLLRACSMRRVSKGYGERLEELATSKDRQGVPVRCAAAEAWAKVDGWKAMKAADAVLNLGDGQLRRALTLSLRHGGVNGRGIEAALRRISSVVPECRPAVKYVKMGRSRVERSAS